MLQFDGHLDAIVVPHAPPVLDLEAGVVRGRGSADMKGGLAAIAHAVRALLEAQVPLAGGLLVTAHGLHEAPGGDQRTLRSILSKGVRGDAALVAELSHYDLPIAAKGMIALAPTRYSQVTGPQVTVTTPPVQVTVAESANHRSTRAPLI